MRSLTGAAAALLAAVAGATFAQPQATAVQDTSFVEANGDRVLQMSAVVAAPPAEVWRSLASADGWKRMGVQMAVVDFRVGGVIETNYRAGAQPGERGNIKNEIVAHVPERLLVIRNVQAPPTFPHPEAFARTATVIELEPAGAGETRIRLTGVGFRPGADYDQLYAMFRAGNAFSLEKLRQSWAGASTSAAESAAAARKFERK